MLANDTDRDGDPLTVFEVTQPAQGQVTISADAKSVLFTPPDQFTGVATFTYKVKDGCGSESVAAVQVKVVEMPVTITGITEDTGASDTDNWTKDRLLILKGSAAPNQLVRVYLGDVEVTRRDGRFSPVVTGPDGVWQLNEGTIPILGLGRHAFRAVGVVSLGMGIETAPTAPFWVTVDYVAPTVDLRVMTTSRYDQTPDLLIRANDNFGPLPNGTKIWVDVDRDNDWDFTEAGDKDYAIGVLMNGSATITLTNPLPVGTDLRIRARVEDVAGNVGTSSPLSHKVEEATQFKVIDIRQVSDGEGQLVMGSSLDLDLSPGMSAQAVSASLVYNSGRVAPRPIFQISVQTPNQGAVPPRHLYVLLRADIASVEGRPRDSRIGNAGGVVDFQSVDLTQLQGFTGGSVVTFALQEYNALLKTGYYSWTIEVGTASDVKFTAEALRQDEYAEDKNVILETRRRELVAGPDQNVIAPGWGFSFSDRLYPILGYWPIGEFQAVRNEAMLRVTAAGTRLYIPVATNVFQSPVGDFGRLVRNPNGTYTYTLPSTGESLEYNSNGLLTSWRTVSQSGTVQFGYTDSDEDGQSDDIQQIQARDISTTTFEYQNGRLARIVSPGNRDITFNYAGANLESVVFPDDGTRRFGYSPSGQLKSEEVNGTNLSFKRDWEYYEESRLLHFSREGRNETEHIPAPQGFKVAPSTALPWDRVLDGERRETRTLRIFDSLPENTRWAGLSVALFPELAFSNRTDTIRPGGEITREKYDALGRVRYNELPDGTSFTSQYFKTGIAGNVETNLVKLQTFSTGAERSWVYSTTDPNTVYNPVRLFTDELGQSTEFIYFNDRLQLVKYPDFPENVYETYEYWIDGPEHRRGLLKSAKDPLGNITLYEHDDKRRLTKIIYPDGTFEEFKYDLYGSVQLHTDRLGLTSFSLNDKVGRPTWQIDAAWNTNEYRYDAGVLVRTVGPLGHETVIRYNPERLESGRTVSLGGATLAVTEAHYDRSGLPVWVKDGGGLITVMEYDPARRPSKVTEAVGTPAERWRTTSYLPGGHVWRETDPLGLTTEHERTFNPKLADTYQLQTHLLVVSTQGVGSDISRVTKQGFDKGGNLIWAADANGIVTRYQYDKRGRVISVTEAYRDPFFRRTTHTKYDLLGRVEKVTDPYGVDTLHQYDDRRRVETIFEDEGGPNGRATRLFRDAAGRTRQQVNPNETIVFTAYDDRAGTVTTKTRGPSGQWLVHSRKQDVLGRTVLETDPLGVLTVHGYDDAARKEFVSELVVTPLAPLPLVLRATTTIRDQAGNIHSVTDPVGNTTVFVHDVLGRLTSETNELGTHTYRYDAVDNLRLAIDRNGRRRVFEYNDFHELTHEHWLSAAGSEVRLLRYNYDKGGRLESAWDFESHYVMQYDELNRLRVVDRKAQGNLPQMAVGTQYTPNSRNYKTIIDAVDVWTTETVIDSLGRVRERKLTRANMTSYKVTFTYTQGWRALWAIWADWRPG